MKLRMAIVVLLTSLTLAAPYAWAHGGDGHGDGHKGHDHDKHHACKYYLPKVDLPNLDGSPWEAVDTLQSGFTFTFYHDTDRPEIPVAAMKVYGVDPTTGAPHTRITWQVGEGIRTVRLEIEEMVCVRSIFADDGSYRDLLGPYVKLRNEKELDDVPEAAKRAYELAGKSASRGQIRTTLATETKLGGIVGFTALIMVFDTPDVALFFYLGVDGGRIHAPTWHRIVEIRWKEGDSVRVWSRKELTLDDGGRILIKPPLHQRPEFTPLAPDSVF